MLHLTPGTATLSTKFTTAPSTVPCVPCTLCDTLHPFLHLVPNTVAFAQLLVPFAPVPARWRLQEQESGGQKAAFELEVANQDASALKKELEAAWKFSKLQSKGAEALEAEVAGDDVGHNSGHSHICHNCTHCVQATSVEVLEAAV